MPILNRRTTHAITAASLAAAAVLGVLALSQWGGDEAPEVQSAEAPLFLFADDKTSSLPAHPALASARRVASVGELRSASGGEAGVLLLESNAARSLTAGALRDFARDGWVVIGLNLPIDELVTLTSFDAELANIDSKFADADVTPGTFAGDYFTLVWKTPPGSEPAYWGRLQNDLTPELFSAVVAQHRLLVRGLVMEDGQLKPLERYGSGGELR